MGANRNIAFLLTFDLHFFCLSLSPSNQQHYITEVVLKLPLEFPLQNKSLPIEPHPIILSIINHDGGSN